MAFGTARWQAPHVQLLDALDRVVCEQGLPLGTEHALRLVPPTVGASTTVACCWLADGVETRALVVQP